MIRILVIDTDPGERLILRSRLADQGYEVVLADTGAKGLVEARSEAFDLILLSADLSEGVDGAEVCRRLKAIPRRILVPVLVYSHQTPSYEASERVYEAGCDAFVAKGQMATLDRVIRVMLQLKGRFDEMGRELRSLEQEQKSLQEQLAREQESVAKNDSGNNLLVRELAAGRPDGLIVVDTQGAILHVDRGACELFGARIEGKTLGQVAPGSGLEAFVRDARTQPREQFRFDIRLGKGRAERSLMASVVPVASSDTGESGAIRVVLLLDVGKRRLLDEVARQREAGVPRQQWSTLLEAARSAFGPHSILGTSPEVTALRRRVIELLRRDDPVLIRGERGAGKSFIANVLHYGGRANGGLWTLRSSSLAPENVELDLFGCVEGAVPGVIGERPGLCLQAAGGTLLLLEVADLSLEAQESLLAVLETGAVLRRGSSKPEKVHFRLIATSEYDLGELVKAGRFSSGLYAKLSACVLDVPPLRNVISDLPQLVEHFLRLHNPLGSGIAVDEHVLWLMQQYEWPGNVAELQDCIEEASRRAKGESIMVEHLTRPLRELNVEAPGPEIPRRPAQPRGASLAGLPIPAGDNSRHLRPWDITDEDPISLEHYEKKALMRALDSCGGDKLAAARLLKVGKSTLYRKLKRLGIS